MRRAPLLPILLLSLLFGAAGSLAAPTNSELIAEAEKHWSAGQLTQAQTAFESAVAAQPDAVIPRLRLAGFQLANQQTTASIENYRKIISQAPGNSTAWIGLGLAYLHSGRPELARAALAEAVRVDPARQDKIGPLIARLDTR